VSIVVLDRDGLVQSWNPASELIFGWSEGEALGRPLPYIPEEKQTEHRLLRQRVLDGESFTGVETSRRRKDGSSIDISIYTAPLRDAEGIVTGILGINVDVTERKNSEARLHEQMHHMTALRRIDAAISGTFELRAMLPSSRWIHGPDVSSGSCSHPGPSAGLPAPDSATEIESFRCSYQRSRSG
jgi:PAS domain S-box-containing protein